MSMGDGMEMSMIVELRRYSVRPGLMRSMQTRMRDVLLPLFAEHGVPSPLAVWETDEPGIDSVMTWMLNWRNLEERNSTWAHFRPTWEAAKKARAEEEFVTRTDLTLIDAWPSNPLSFPSIGEACESAWIVQPTVGCGAAFRAACLDQLFRAFGERGAISIAACDFVFGPLPQSLVLLSWPDVDSRSRGLSEIGQAVNEFCATNLTGPGTWLPLTRAGYLRTWQLIA
jgi:hypothetical protein